MSKQLKVTVEWEDKTYTKQENVESVASTVNPGDKTLPLMGEAMERIMIEILGEIVSNSK